MKVTSTLDEPSLQLFGGLSNNVDGIQPDLCTSNGDSCEIPFRGVTASIFNGQQDADLV